MIACIIMICLVNGVFSPALAVVVSQSGLWYPDWLPGTLSMIFFVGMMVTAGLTLLAGAVPALLCRAVLAGGKGSPIPLYVWMAGCALLTVPALANLHLLV
ncbi:hypothetical protein [Telmatospirillum sp. J64-1]|uniref:hypothetical protein n=1 Tax=Telmatospirillum sp. J64-1 TaxID=2502183 RepID=UPI00115D8763|nr:hypothetical protein [Telmatospirillum sp. J64-1]